MANVLPKEKQLMALRMLVEGNSLRAITRMTGVHRTTVMKLLVDFGNRCEQFMDRELRDIETAHVELDEQWTWVGKKQKKLSDAEKKSGEFGDQYLFLGLEQASRLVISHTIGKRTEETTREFIQDLAGRIVLPDNPNVPYSQKPQMSTDGFQPYRTVIFDLFGSLAQHGVLIKNYTDPNMGRYAPPDLAKAERRRIMGILNLATICTSHIERFNCTTRQFCKRFTRLTLAFSKKLENLQAAVALHIAHYNWCWRLRENGKSALPADARDDGRDLRYTLEDGRSLRCGEHGGLKNAIGRKHNPDRWHCRASHLGRSGTKQLLTHRLHHCQFSRRPWVDLHQHLERDVNFWTIFQTVPLPNFEVISATFDVQVGTCYDKCCEVVEEGRSLFARLPPTIRNLPQYKSVIAIHRKGRMDMVASRLNRLVLPSICITAWLAASAGVTLAADDEAFTTGSSDVLVGYINQQVRQGWTDNEIEPSNVAEDEEWIRRVYLDVVGHVPPFEMVESFLADKDPAKRAKLIDQLLEDPAYVRNWTTVWSNLCVGRGNPRQGMRVFYSREGMEKFFREAFAKNRPWNEIVYDLVSGEGHFEKNGAVNYLLAQMQMPDDAVQATAKTTRLFMGIQVQCTQCHDHPFNDWKQDQFWSFNSFFRQMRKDVTRKYDPQRGRMVDDYLTLVRRDFSGPVYYEERSGIMRVAYPNYFSDKIDPGPEVDRRTELAKLMTAGDEPWIAKAFVNRMWGHFFGYGFTKPVDDMGPHKAVSHPELLDRLSVEFVKSGYDVKQLIRWITNSEAYNLTSQFGNKNEIDNPAAGEVPLFSHMYVKQMQAEQLFDSLIIATEAHKTGRMNWDQAEQQRREWMQQFVVAFNTDENDESTTFNGTIPQALMMMNGDLVQDAVSIERGSFLRRVLEQPGPDSKRIRRLYYAALSRAPTRREIGAATKLIRNRKGNEIEAYQDLFWALLNSNEFIFIH